MSHLDSFRNPANKPCFEGCNACRRCQNKKQRRPECRTCSGYIDPQGEIEEHVDDFCMCSEGVLRKRLRSGVEQGRLVIAPYKKNPFKSTVQVEAKTEDERDWDAYVGSQREQMNNPNWNPIQEY